MRSLIRICCVLFLLAPLGAAHANNDLSSAYRSGSISVPSVDEGGANDASSVDVNQGRASYSIPIELPPGHPNLTPSLSLRYHGSRQEGVLGAGWSLAHARIRVRTSGRGGQPRWGVSARYLGLSGEELVELSSTLGDVDGDGFDETLYREERDQLFVRYVALSNGGWIAQYPDGRLLTFGTTSNARIARSGHPDQVAEWLPEVLVDRSGNEIRWRWSNAATVASALGGTAYNEVARYLVEMRWACQSCATASTYQVAKLGYELLADPVANFGPGFLVETELALVSVDTETVIGGVPTPVRTYAFGYDSSGTRRLLTTVDVEAADGASLPTVTIGYTDRTAPASNPDALGSAPGAPGFASGVQPVDVDLDGRVDVVDLSNVGSGGHYYRHTGLAGAALEGSSTPVANPPGSSLASGGIVSAEDGTRDVAIDVFDLGTGMLFAHDRSNGWDTSGVAATLPAITTTLDTVRIDVNADGYVDLLDTSVDPWVAYLDDGSHTYTADTVAFDPATTPTFGAALAASDSGVLFGELNGDGLVDVAYLDANGVDVHVWYGRGLGGFGWLPEDGRALPYSTLTIHSSVGVPSRDESILQDVDGDGLGDLVSFDSASSRLRVWQRIPGGGFDDTTTQGPFAQTINAGDGCRVADWDIDGVAEILCSDGWMLYDWADRQPYLLESVDNGLGLITRLRYTTTARVAAEHEEAGHPWERNVSMAMTIVAATETDDSRGNVLVAEYDYRDATYEADELEDRFEFVGFGYIAVKEIAYLEATPGNPASRHEDPQDPGVMRRRFFDGGESDFFLRGKLLCEETWSRDVAITGFECDPASDGPLVRLVQTWGSETDGDGVTRLELRATDRYVIEGGSISNAARIRTELEHDEWGNRTTELHYGAYSGSADAFGDDEAMVVTDFIRNTDEWILRLPRRTQRGDVAFGASPSLVVLEETCFEYDGVSGLCSPGYAGGLDGAVTTGLRTATLQLIDEDLEDGVPGTLTTIERVDYTANGLPNLVADALGQVVNHDWDRDFNLFPRREIVDPSGLALTTRFEVDPTHGQTTRITHPNGSRSAATYDGLGRITRLLRDGDTLASPSLERVYSMGTPTSTIMDVAEDGLGGLVTIREVDGAGRLLCERKERAGAGWDITAQREYTARGVVALELLPTVAPGCETLGAGPSGRTSTRPHNRVEIDALERAIAVTHEPSGARRTTSHGVLSTTLADEADTDATSPHFGTATTHHVDGLGRIAAVVELLDGDGDGTPEAYETTYSHDARGNLVEVVDPLGASVYRAAYDSRGLRVWSEDADRGLETLRYDTLGQLLESVDANGHVLAYTHDAASRVQSIGANDGVSVETTVYEYDQHPAGGAASAACHTGGRLARVVDGSGESSFCYDAYGNTVEESVTIDGTTYTTSRVFDALDRIETLTHPDGTALRYGYDVGGRATTLTVESGADSYPIITDARYDAAGQPTRLDYGNGVRLLLGYDDRQRPRSHAAVLGGSPLYALQLQLDAVGNVEAITDAVGQRGARFEHDDFYRLTLAEGDAFGGETLTYAYDARGNLVARSHSDPSSPLHIDSLRHDGLAVHQLTSVDRDGDGVDDESFVYDAVGNLEADGSHSFAFDPYGMLREVSGVVSHRYDFLQRRVVADYVSGDSVVFVRAANAEVRNVGGTTSVRKHVSFAGRTVAVVEDTFTSADVEDHVFLIGFDHLGSPVQAWDVAPSPTVVERWAGHPFGAENDAPFVAAGTAADYRAPGDPASVLSRRFQGREIDLELPEQYDFGARVYRSDLGRFLSADSVVPNSYASQSWNRYAFVRNNPLRHIDPTGHSEEPAVGDTVTLVVGETVEAGPEPAAAPASPWTFNDNGSVTYTTQGGSTFTGGANGVTADFGRVKIGANPAAGSAPLTLGDGTASAVTVDLVNWGVGGSALGVGYGTFFNAGPPGLMAFGADAAYAAHATGTSAGYAGSFHGWMAAGGAGATALQAGGAATLTAAPYMATVGVAWADAKFRQNQIQAWEDAMEFQLETTGSIDGWHEVAEQMLHGPGAVLVGPAGVNEAQDIMTTFPAGSTVTVPMVR